MRYVYQCHRLLRTHSIGCSWSHTPGMTLIGDAAHLTVISSEGANFAMLDGLELGLVLADVISKGLDKARVESTSTHGTGCTLSAAIAALLGKGESGASGVLIFQLGLTFL